MYSSDTVHLLTMHSILVSITRNNKKEEVQKHAGMNRSIYDKMRFFVL